MVATEVPALWLSALISNPFLLHTIQYHSQLLKIVITSADPNTQPQM